MRLSDAYLSTLKAQLIASGSIGKTVFWRGEDHTITGVARCGNDYGVRARTPLGRSVWISTVTAYAAVFGEERIGLSPSLSVVD